MSQSPLRPIRTFYFQPDVGRIHEHALDLRVLAGQEFAIDHAVGQNIELTLVMEIGDMLYIMGQRVGHRAHLHPLQVEKPLVGQELMHGGNKGGPD